MKKIFTLFAGLLMAAAVFAADRRPSVTVINSNRNYKVMIDGRPYFGSSMSAINLDNGYGNAYGSRMHTIKVYELRRGFFVRERLVDAATFMVGRNDMMIKIDFFGQIKIREMKDYGRYDMNGRGNSGWDDKYGRGNNVNNGWDDKRWDGGQEYDGHNSRGQDQNGYDNKGQDQNGTDNRDPRDNRVPRDPRDGRNKGF